MIKRIITSSILGTLLLSSIAFAQGTSTSTPGSTIRKTNSACVLAATHKRNTSLKTAQEIFNKAISDARSARKSALEAANKLTDKTAKKAAVKAAQDAYKNTANTARDAFRNARKAAQDQFKVEQKACRTARSSK